MDLQMTTVVEQITGRKPILFGQFAKIMLKLLDKKNQSVIDCCCFSFDFIIGNKQRETEGYLLVSKFRKYLVV